MNRPSARYGRMHPLLPIVAIGGGLALQLGPGESEPAPTRAEPPPPRGSWG